ncbi:MAG: metal-dependent hydrolase [Candidatus Sungbacteria bacterium]|nr:metal-dependent hydrolase [Candidatus Sungbacteria bacterium]
MQMFIDLAVGVLVYTGVSYLFGQGFSWLFFVVGVKFAFFPDIDFFLFLLLRRKYNLVSHHLVHFPLVLSSVGVLSWFGITGGWYFPAMFFFATMGHFIHDGFSEVGIRWLWPFSNQYYTFTGYRIAKAEKRDEIIGKLKETKHQRSIVDEFLMRWENPNRWSIAFLLAASILAVTYAVR